MDPGAPFSPSDLATLAKLLSSGGNVAMMACVWLAWRVKDAVKEYFGQLNATLLAVAETNRAQTKAVEALRLETEALRNALAIRKLVTSET